MSDVGKAIFTILSTDTTVSGLVAYNSNTLYGIFPVNAPKQASKPYITYTFLSSDPFADFTGASIFDQDLVQLDCFAETRDAAVALAQAVRLALDRATLGTYGGVFIKQIDYVTRREFDESAEVERLYRVSIDFLFSIDRAADLNNNFNIRVTHTGDTRTTHTGDTRITVS